MKRQALIVFTIAFILLAPLFSLGIFALPETHTLEEQDPIRDNTLAEEVDLTSTFAATLPRDIIYYPDSFTNTTEAIATSGEDDYADSLAVDAVTWVVTFGTNETINYDYNKEYILDGFTYHHYGYYSSAPNPAWCALEYYNNFTGTWDTVMNFTRDTPVNPHWTNDTFYFPDKFTPLALGLRVIASSSDSSTGSTDYLGIEMIYLTTYSDEYFADITEAVATNGEDDYADSFAVDAVTWVVTFGTHEGIYYDYDTELILDGFTYHHYGYYASAPNPAWCALEYYNSFTDTWDTVMNFTRDTPVNPHWTNDTFYFPDKFTTLALLLRVIASSSDSSTGSTDYLGIEMIYFTTYSNDSYGESFSDVSDWNVISGSTPTSDNDTMNWAHPGDSAWDFIETDSPSLISGQYLEVAYRCNLDVADQIRIYLASGDGYTGDTQLLVTLQTSTTWKPYRAILPQDVECFRIGGWASSATDFEFDYMRGSKPNDIGWQHDGSTIEAVTALTGGSVSSDGSELSLIADSDGSTFEIIIDTTATASMLGTAYYPFLGISFNSGDSTDYMKIESYDGSAWATIISNQTIGTDTLRANIKVIDSFIEKFRLSVNPSATARMKWLKAYSIENYTYSSSGVGTDDYLYVEDGVIISNIDSGSITLDYDPVFLLNGSYTWDKSTSLGDSYLSFYYGGWKSYSSDTTGTFVMNTITDYRIMFNESANIINIHYFPTPTQWHSFTMEPIYFDMPNWHLFTMEDIIFFIPINELNISYLLMLGGLVMIPTSTVLLVKGGRSDLSRDKLFLFFLMFLFGWALFLGGIL